MNLTQQIEIIVGNEKAVAVLLEKDAPRTCKAVLNALPLTGGLVHAKFAGGEFFFATPIFEELENPVRKQNPGNICYWPVRQSICIFYKELPGVGEVSLFARIVKNLEGIQREGQKGWIKQGAPIKIAELKPVSGGV